MTRMLATQSISSPELLWALGSLCGLHRIAFDPQLVLHHCPPPYTLGSLLKAAQALGFKTGHQTIAARALARMTLPCLARVRPAPGSPAILVLIVKADAERVLCVEAGTQTPCAVSSADFEARFTGEVLLFKPQVKLGHGEEAEAPAFGFRWFVPELLKHKAIWRDVLLASLAIQLMGLGTPLFTQVVIDKVVVHHTLNTLLVIAIALSVFMVFTALMSWVRQYLILHTGNRIDAVLGTEVFAHLLRLPLRYFEQRPTGVLVARLQGVETIREFLASAAVTLLLDAPFLLIFLGLMFSYSVPLSLLALTLLGGIVALSFSVAPRLRARLNQQFLLGARTQAFLTEYLAGMETVKSLQMEPGLQARYGDYLAASLAAGFKTKQLGNTYNVTAASLEQLMSLGILCLGAYSVMTRTDFSIGMLVAFQMFASRLSQPLLRLVGLWQQFQQARIAVARLGDVMEAPSEPYALIPSRARAGAGEIEVRQLAFRYAEHLPCLFRQLSFTLRPGMAVALMGPSGSGKSTLAKLLQGFYTPSEGQILIDGRDTRGLAANELRSYFGVVPQETVLFSGTIYDNLLQAHPHAAFEEVVAACTRAEIHALIESWPQGYLTAVGERGVGLSGGQKQRLAIARALLKRPKVLIFDEATSHLDTPTAEHFARTINQLKGSVTLLFIAHQLPRGLQLDARVQLGAHTAEAPAALAQVS